MEHEDLTKRIIGCCFEVHRALGPGFPEKVYQSALLASMRRARLSVERERRFDVTFDGSTVGEFQVDFLIEDRIVLETKAVAGMMPRVFAAQLLAYLKAAKRPVGLLVNFGNPSCQVKRVVLSSVQSVKSHD